MTVDCSGGFRQTWVSLEINTNCHLQSTSKSHNFAERKHFSRHRSRLQQVLSASVFIKCSCSVGLLACCRRLLVHSIDLACAPHIDNLSQVAWNISKLCLRRRRWISVNFRQHRTLLFSEVQVCRKKVRPYRVSTNNTKLCQWIRMLHKHTIF